MKGKRITAWIVTVLLAMAAMMLGYNTYLRHMANPWTRDGLVQADIVLVAPRVTGPISTVNVVNNQAVRTGDLLFTLDPAPYQTEVDGAEATLAVASAMETEKEGVARRVQAARRADAQAVSDENLQQATDALESARASRRQAEANLEIARLRLQYTRVSASVDGYVTNVTIQPGTLAVADSPLFALIDVGSFRVTGFFRETLVSHVPLGGRAEVTLMAYPGIPLEGEVESINWGISRGNGSEGNNLLPVVTPTFDWIRLAQRVPVNIRLTHIPPKVLLRVGLTASVQVRADETQVARTVNF